MLNVRAEILTRFEGGCLACATRLLSERARNAMIFLVWVG